MEKSKSGRSGRDGVERVVREPRTTVKPGYGIRVKRPNLGTVGYTHLRGRTTKPRPRH
jgi:hypothetical protein